MASGFVACIRRSGSSFFKVPRASGMSAVPASTRFDNLNTYFQPWPKRFSTYVLSDSEPSQVDSPAKQPKQQAPKPKFTLAKLRQQYRKGEPLVMVTSYDTITTRLAEAGNIDILLVGDSVGNVMLGYDSTVPVTMDEMVLHTRSVARAAKRALVIGDMPFGSYLTPEAALVNATRLLKEGGCDAVKLEGGARVAHIVETLVNAGIAVMGHVGLTPQTHAQLGGYRMQGKTTREAFQLLEDAESLQKAGAFSIVLECVPTQLAEEATRRLAVPTIGIGAGPHCSGQVLVCADMLGTHPSPPRFVKKYANLGSTISEAFAEFRKEVETGAFPAPQHCSNMSSDALAEFRSEVGRSQDKKEIAGDVVARAETRRSQGTKEIEVQDPLVAELRQEIAELRELAKRDHRTEDAKTAAPVSRAAFLTAVTAAGASLAFGKSQSVSRSDEISTQRCL